MAYGIGEKGIDTRLNFWPSLVPLCGSAGKESACNAEDLGLIPGLGISPGEGKGYSLQYSGLENSMDSIVHGVTKSRTGQSGFRFHLSLKSLLGTCLRDM